MVKLRPYQMDDLVFMMREKKCMLLSDPGTGKTPPVIVNQWRRWSVDGIKTCWVMPKSLLMKNVDEILVFSNFRPQDVVVVDGTAAKVEKALASPAKIFLMGPDRFKLSGDKLPADVQAIDVDEFHMCFGGGRSARTQAFLKHASKIREMVLMTGTLVNGRLDTTWPAIHAIDPRYYPLGYDQFLSRHAVLDDYGTPIFWKDHEHIQKILKRHSVRRTFEDVFGCQKPVVQKVELQLSGKQLGYYKEFEEKAAIELEEAMVSGSSPGVFLIRARQIMEHPRSFPDPMNPGKFVDLVKGQMTAKEEWLEIQLQDSIQSGDPMVIFAALRPQQQAIYNQVVKAGLTCGLMDAKASTKQRGQLDKDFVSGKIQVIVASPPIASTGFNWQFWGPNRVEVPHCVFMSLDYMDSNFIQAYRRFIRQERKRALRVSVPIYKGTVDERLLTILRDKSKDANRVDPTREVLEFS